MVVSPTAWARDQVTDPRDRWFFGGLGALTLLALWCRWAGLSHGSFFRDDAWVALSSRVPWHDAWRMVGTAPGFVLFERLWVGFTAPSTWNAQVATLVASLVAVVVCGLVARWWGLSRGGALLVAALIAIGRVDVQYATRLKPYATDVIAGALVLCAAEWWRRHDSAWPFALISLVALATSFSVAPVVLGCGVVGGFEALRAHRVRPLLGPAAALVIPFGLLYWRVRGGISSELRHSWAANFFSFASPHRFLDSVRTIFGGLAWGFIDTTPHWHVPGLSKLIIAAVFVSAVLGVFRWRSTLLPVASVVVAVLLAALRVEPLGTGRTDAYLYPALALLCAYGVTVTATWLHQWRALAARTLLAAVVVLVAFLAVDTATHRPGYPGGSITPVAAAVSQMVAQDEGVLIEGTARWPWTYYEESPVLLTFSDRYNTGFAPLSDDPEIEVMPGTVIEQDYHPKAAVRAVDGYSTVLYVRTDDWPGMGDPLKSAFVAAGYREVKHSHPPGYFLEWWAKGAAVATTG